VARFDRVIPPGGEGKISLKLHTRGYSGAIAKSARVFTNDPHRGEVLIGLKGTVWTPIEIHPPYVRLRGVQGEEIQETVRLLGKEEDPLNLTVKAVSIPDKVTVTVQVIRKGRAYDLIVKNIACQGGAYSGTITLATSAPEMKEVAIQVSGYIEGLLEVRPHVLDYGQTMRARLSQLEKAGISISRPVTVTLNRGDNLKVDNAALDKSLFKVTRVEARGQREVRLVLAPVLDRLQDGMNRDMLRIHTNQDGGKVVTVPIRMEIR
jgi:hypothetical protein